MAKVNEGNLLQHFVECEAARQLIGPNSDKNLHVAFTHGMAPFEPAEDIARSHGDVLGKILISLQAPNGPQGGYPFAVLGAYQCVHASVAQYPNSAVLLRDGLGLTLHGVLCESQDAIATMLRAWFPGIAIQAGSWRTAARNGFLNPPPSLRVPWLFSMDPYTYHEVGAKDDGDLYKEDAGAIVTILEPYLKPTAAGMASIFCYSMDDCHSGLFEVFMRGIRDALNSRGNTVDAQFIRMPISPTKQHVAGLIARDACLLRGILKRWDEFWRGGEPS